MFNRVVSLSSLAVAIVSAAFFLLGAWWLLMGEIGEIDGVFALAGWLMAAVIFAWRFADPAWLEPVSIIKTA